MNNTPPEVLEKWRAEFERAIYPHFKMTDPPHDKRLDGGKYFYAHMNVAWAAFCIARQSVRIELPHIRPFGEDECDHFYNEGLFDCSQTIQCQGYKVNK